MVRNLMMGVCLLLCAGACSSDEPTTTALPSDLTSLTIATTTSTAPMTTTTVSLTTTTTAPPRVFHMEWGPIDGQYTNADVPPSLGGVRPDALVTLNGMPTDTDFCGSWAGWGDIYCWGFGFTEEGLPQFEVDLDEGRNALVYQALFDDGATMNVELTVHYVPTLTETEGWLVDVVPGNPPTAVIDFVEIEPGEDDGLDVAGEPRRESVPIAENAAFIILEQDTPGNRPAHVRSTVEMLDLVATVKAGGTVDFLFWGYLLPEEDMIGGVPSTFLINIDGELQQMEQWWSP